MVDTEGPASDASSCCCRLYERIADHQPCVTEEDGEARFWHQRAKCSRFDLVFPLFAALLFLADVGMDCELATTHFNRGDHKWAAFTLAVIVFSLVFADSLSAIFYRDDQKDEGKTDWLTYYDLQVKPWFYAFHFIFCGRLLRCFQIFKTVRLIRKIRNKHPDNTELYRLYISQLQDLSVLSVVEAFTEQAPQIALQFYILVQNASIDWTSFADLFVVINIVKSLALFSFSLLNFCRFLRLGQEKSELLELFSFGSLFHFTWRLFMLVSRILALVLFASLYKAMVFVVVGIHLVFSHLLLLKQPNRYFSKGLDKLLLRCAFTFINVFCFFPLAGKRTRNWGIPYYLVTFTENSILVLLWYFRSDWTQLLKVIMLVTEWGAFVFGLLSVFLYYGVFHPSFNRTIRPPSPDDEEDTGEDAMKQFESNV